MNKTIYLDNSATTKISPAALRAYCDAAEGCFGNPSSLHKMGVDAERIIEGARTDILASLYTKSGDIIFTASGSEANNLAIFGRAEAKARFKGGKILTTMGEHASVKMPLLKLKEEGFSVVEIPTRGGEIDLDILRREATGNVILAAMMLVNNETGAVYNIPEVAKILRAGCPDVYIHIDATQGYMKIPFSPEALSADSITISSHKIAGPKGVGALYISPRVKKEHGIAPVTLGGGQEGGMRSGTENVPGIAGFAAAAKEGFRNIRENISYMESLRAYLIERIEGDAGLSEISISKPKEHAPHILNITLPKIKSETMLHYLSAEGIYVSSGSACSSNTGHTSSALVAFGRTPDEADTSVRISFSPENTKSDVDALCLALENGLSRLSRIKK